MILNRPMMLQPLHRVHLPRQPSLKTHPLAVQETKRGKKVTRGIVTSRVLPAGQSAEFIGHHLPALTGDVLGQGDLYLMQCAIVVQYVDW